MSDVQAFLKSLWVLGIWHQGRFAFWNFCATTLILQPRKFHHAVELAIYGHHFRRVARSL
jgi:hypothetical protein